MLKEEEVIPRILAIEGRRGRLKSLDPLSSPAGDPARSRRKGRAPDDSEADVLSTSEAKLLRKLEAQGTASETKTFLKIFISICYVLKDLVHPK